MKLKTIFIVLSAVLFTYGANAQKLIPGEKGKSYLEFLKGQEKIKLAFVYDDMQVGKMTEEAYVAKKKEEYNEKEAGRGDKWEKMWVEDRSKRFSPKFKELFNKYVENDGLSVDESYDDAKYTMTVKTTWTEPGYYIGISSKPALISGKIVFAETSNPEKALAEIEFIKAPGNSMATWDTGERIKESYAKLGKTLAQYLSKKVF